MSTNNDSDRVATDARHNDFVGGNASKGRIPGADHAMSGHSFVSVFPGEGEQKRHADGVSRPDEHLPPTTGRDRPPRGINQPTITTQSGPQFEQSAPQPLAPAPDSITIVDEDPFATPTSAADTLTGATSKDLYGGIGKPAGGMTSAELHHDGQTHRKRHGQGTDQYGPADD